MSESRDRLPKGLLDFLSAGFASPRLSRDFFNREYKGTGQLNKTAGRCQMMLVETFAAWRRHRGL